MRILLVDDEPSILRALEAELVREGHECVLAADGRDALERLGADAHGVELVISDVAMPVLGGLDLLRTVKQERPTVPIILMSGADRTADTAVRAQQLGADDYLLKPFKDGEVSFAATRAL